MRVIESVRLSEFVSWRNELYILVDVSDRSIALVNCFNEVEILMIESVKDMELVSNLTLV